RLSDERRRGALVDRHAGEPRTCDRAMATGVPQSIDGPCIRRDCDGWQRLCIVLTHPTAAGTVSPLQDSARTRVPVEFFTRSPVVGRVADLAVRRLPRKILHGVV